MDQRVPYWNPQTGQMSIDGILSGSVEIFLAMQAAGAAGVVPIGIATRAGHIVDARLAAITPLTGNATFTANLLRNGVSILTAPMALLVGTAARASILGALTSPTLTVAAGDFFEVVFTSVPGTGTAPANIVAQLQLVLN